MGGSQDQLNPGDVNYICGRTSDEVMSERKELLYKTAGVFDQELTPQESKLNDKKIVNHGS